MARRPDTIDAKLFNLWHRAKTRLGPTIYPELCGLKSMRMILEQDFWVVADSANYYVPVLAWTDFDADGRMDIYKPIGCQLKYYHFAASAVRAKSLNLMQAYLQDLLADETQSIGKPASVHSI